jgi:hypothetical protein
VALGTVFQTGNGGDHKGGIKAKKIYHAVVATQSRLVNETAIIKSVVKSLTQADADGCHLGKAGCRAAVHLRFDHGAD